jgi:hypothetical protein
MRLFVMSVWMMLIGTAPAGAAPLPPGHAYMREYRALKRQVKQQYRALQQASRVRVLTPMERQGLDHLREARSELFGATFYSLLAGTVATGAVALTGLGAAALIKNPSWTTVGQAGSSAFMSFMMLGPVAAARASRDLCRALAVSHAKQAGLTPSERLLAPTRETLRIRAEALCASTSAAMKTRARANDLVQLADSL